MVLKIKKGGNIRGLKAGQKSIKIIKKRFHQIKIKKASQEEGHVQDLREITNQKDKDRGQHIIKKEDIKKKINIIQDHHQKKIEKNHKKKKVKSPKRKIKTSQKKRNKNQKIGNYQKKTKKYKKNKKISL